MTILIIHYHLRTGGVTRVIETQARALAELGHQVVVASSGPVEGFDFETLVIPGLDYCRSGKADFADLLKLEADLRIVHNPTLGKNVHFPELIRYFAASCTPLLMQCHDFAEDGRPSNYELLENHELYPLASHVHYAFINQRDRSILIKAGVPEERCHYLPNAVVPPKMADIQSSQTPLIFCPVRGIRRKNLGELCLLAAHAPKEASFAMAVAPENPEWIAVHNEWSSLADQLELRIDFDVADRLAPPGETDSSFGGWLGHATHLVTTSIAEGFGLTFLEPAFLKKPLIGRDLPEITSDFHSKLGTLYREIPIPLPYLDLDELKSDYLETLAATLRSYHCQIEAYEMDHHWEKFIAEGWVDFGNLPEKHQARIIGEYHLPFLEEWLTEALKVEPIEIDTTSWHLKNYGLQLGAIIEKTGSHSDLEWLPKERVLEEFVTPERFHFLKT